MDRKRLEAYAEAFGIATAKQITDEEISTTGSVRDSFADLRDGEMLVIPIGGETDEYD